MSNLEFMGQYNSKAEAEKDRLYTSRVIFLFFFIIAIVFVLMTKTNAFIYVAIKASPVEVVAEYEKTVRANEYRTDNYFKYKDFRGDSHYYIFTGQYLDKVKEINLLYSRFFPRVAFFKDEINALKIDVYIFSFGLFFIFIFAVFFIVYGLKIYLLNKTVKSG